MKFSNKLIPELNIYDFNKSLNFYNNILGFSILYQREDEGFAFLTLGDAQIMIDQIDKGRTWKSAEFEYPLGRGVNFQIEVKSINSLLKNLQDNKIKLFLEVEEKWYKKNDMEVGNKQFIVQDPDGYLLRFCEDLGERPINP